MADISRITTLRSQSNCCLFYILVDEQPQSITAFRKRKCK